MIANLDALIDFERTTIHYAESPPHPAEGIALRRGSRPVLFSAPHACRHKRGRRWKQEDEYTATIAEWLHRLTGAHAMYLTHSIDPDPHDDDSRNIYKKTLAGFVEQNPVALVIDLHGIMGNRQFGIALGTMKGQSCTPYQTAVIECFEEVGFRRHTPHHLDTLAVNHPRYTGGLTMPTITRFAHQELGLAAVQIEINAWVRVLERLPHATNAQENNAPHFRGDPLRFQRMIRALSQIVARVSPPEIRGEPT